MNTNLIASANTTNGFAIGIIATTNYRTGSPYFAVVRMDRHSRYVTLGNHGTEAAARAQANREYFADRA